jgi:predicted HTH transcriptional regulator
MDDDYIASIIQTEANESLSLEFKAAFSWENKHSAIGWLQAQVLQAILGFTNTEGGGLLIIGIKDDGNGNREFTGVSSEILESYSNVEAIQECIDKYADGPLSYTLKPLSYENGDTKQTYIVISINEFKTSPVLCTRDLCIKKNNDKEEYVLRKYDLYARSRKGRFGNIRATNLELQEIIGLAHSKAEERIIQLFGSVADIDAPRLKTASRSPYADLDTDL